jgi:hypothetical protein
MNFLTKVALESGKGLARGAAGGIGSRMLVGGAAGGAYQALFSDKEQSTNYLGSIGKGILAGSLLGAGSRLITPALTQTGLKKPLLMRDGFLKKMPGRALSAGKMAINTAVGVTNFALRHPYATAGIIGGGYALMNISSEPIYSSDIYSSNPRSNISYGNSNQRLMDSTMGLVGGLYQSRHG